MYKVPTKILKESADLLKDLSDYLEADEKKHYEENPTKGHIYRKVKKAKKLSKLIKLNFYV